MGMTVSTGVDFITTTLQENQIFEYLGFKKKLEEANDEDVIDPRIGGLMKQKKLFRDMKPTMKLMNMSVADMKMWYDVFLDVDIDENGSITCSNFCEFFRVTSTKFTDALFFDFKRHQNINFGQFLASMYFFLTADSMELGTN